MDASWRDVRRTPGSSFVFVLHNKRRIEWKTLQFFCVAQKFLCLCSFSVFVCVRECSSPSVPFRARWHKSPAFLAVPVCAHF
jgi:hypothetical protein